MKEQIKILLKFVLRFTLINCIWIIPVFSFWVQGTLLRTLFFSFLISYMYLSWLQYCNKKTVFLQKIAIVTNILYYVSVIIFLFLTGVATFEGIKNVFGLSGWWNLTFAIVFAVGIPVALFTITLFIKERKTPSVIFTALILYVLFDSMTALPFNFLFFYEHLKTASNVEYDRKSLSFVINACDSSITPKYKSAVKNLIASNSKTSNAEADSKKNRENKLKHDKEQLTDELNNGTITKEQYDYSYNNLKNRYRPKDLKKTEKEINEYNTAYTDSVTHQKLLDELQICKIMKLTLDKTINTDSATRLSNRIKLSLIPICNAAPDTLLKSYVKKLYPNKPSSLESIKQLYRFIGNRIAGNEAELNENQQEKYDQDTDMLIAMSLSSSIVIDILPLLLSLLYAKFKRDD